MKQIT